MTATVAADGLFVVTKGRKRPAPVEPLKLPESVLPVRFFETPARSDVTVTMDRMVDEVARGTKRPRLTSEPVDPAIRATVEFLVVSESSRAGGQGSGRAALRLSPPTAARRGRGAGQQNPTPIPTRTVMMNGRVRRRVRRGRSPKTRRVVFASTRS